MMAVMARSTVKPPSIMKRMRHDSSFTWMNETPYATMPLMNPLHNVSHTLYSRKLLAYPSGAIASQTPTRMPNFSRG